MKTRLFSAIVATLVALAPATSAKKVHTIGDSTMANYDESATATRGWCQYLQQFLEGITVNNRGKGGASSKSFYKEDAYWTSVKQQMQEGDYVLIQFAHNDEKNGGADGDSLAAYYNAIGDSDKANATDYRGTTPHGTYRMYLKRYINETRAAGGAVALSADGKEWSSQISIGYTEGTLIETFHAKMALEEVGMVSGEITIEASGKTITVPVRAESVSMEGGTQVKAYWRLENDDSFTLEGPAQVIPQSWSKMYVQRYANPNKATVWPEWTGFDATRKTQRNLIEGDVWPDGEIDEVSGRYIQFAITPSKGTALNIDSIGMFVCGCGGNGMRCHINYSVKPGFADQHTIFAPTKMPANNMLAVQAQPVISLNEGDTLRLRVYPWYEGTATGKTICISDVTIRGRAVDKGTAAIKPDVTEAGAGLKKELYYNTAGRMCHNNKPGLVIVKREFYDGRVVTGKKIN